MIIGRFTVPLASANLIAEASTPFVCMLYFLRIHKAPKDNFYTFNGVMMTITFFLARNVFHTWLTYAKVMPALMDDDLVATFDLWYRALEYTIVGMYLSLVFLNLYWLRLMIKGAIKAVKGGKDKMPELDV
jgi:hypothetical protein